MQDDATEKESGQQSTPPRQPDSEQEGGGRSPDAGGALDIDRSGPGLSENEPVASVGDPAVPTATTGGLVVGEPSEYGAAKHLKGQTLPEQLRDKGVSGAEGEGGEDGGQGGDEGEGGGSID